MLNWARKNLGIVSTESGSDWVIPFVDTVNSVRRRKQSHSGTTLQPGLSRCRLCLSRGSRSKTLLQGILYGGVPELPIMPNAVDEKSMLLIRAMAALHRRVAMLEMTKHEFLDANYRQERTTFADGTTVTVDWDANTFKIAPELK